MYSYFEIGQSTENNPQINCPQKEVVELEILAPCFGNQAPPIPISTALRKVKSKNITSEAALNDH